MMRTKLFPLFSCLLMMSGLVTHANATNSTPMPEPEVGTGEIIGQLAGNAQAVAVQGDYAYVGFETAFAVIDISYKANPMEIGRVEVGELVRQIAVSGKYAYLATNSGLQIINISDPENPQWAGIYDQVLVTQVEIRDESAFILSSNGLEILNLANAPNLTLIGQYETYIITPLDLDLVNDYAFILSGYPDDQVLVIDIVDIENPVFETLFNNFNHSKIEVTSSSFLGVDNACSSMCFTYFDVWSIDFETWELDPFGTHAVFPSWWSDGLESNQFYAYAGKDIGLFVYNYYKRYVTGEPLQIDYYDIGDVQDIVAFDDYVYAASADSGGIMYPLRAGGLFILPAPPLYQTYFPVVRQGQ